MSGETILVVDDEPNIVKLAQMYLERDGFVVISTGNGDDALEKVYKDKPSLVVLDIMLPGIDGLEVCRKLRGGDNPVLILMLTAKDEDIDKILGLEMGADDYLTKPFNPRELVARVKALLRRSDQKRFKAEAPFHLGNLTLDPASHEVRISRKQIFLRAKEFELLLAFIENKGIVLSREKLLKIAWGYDFAGQTRTVDVHVGHLRKKLAESNVRIETVTSVGYKLVVD
ncbi:MAG: response regulator transcription factor [Anaerolineales bacterium]|nr:response regulator transcription factor [Anaerolineales bacterium]